MLVSSLDIFPFYSNPIDINQFISFYVRVTRLVFTVMNGPNMEHNTCWINKDYY